MSSSLSIAIVGGGNVGSSFALKLVNVGKHNVTVVARPDSKRLAQLRDHGIITTKGESCKVAVADSLDVTIPYDLVIVTAAGYQVEHLLPLYKESAGRIFLFLFNIYSPERLRDMFGERAAFGFPVVQATMDDNGLLQYKFKFSMASPLSDQRCVDIFKSSDIPAALKPKMLLWKRCHSCLAMAAIGVHTAGKRHGAGAGATWQESRTVVAGLHAGFALTTSLGYPLYHTIFKVVNSVPTPIMTGLAWLFSRMKWPREQLGTSSSELEHHEVVDSMIAAAQQSNKLSLVPAFQAIKSL
ncbi:hypothetical protein BKA62DRAFT_709784 [Auriculariales sp. MPI-PUGE-AT-0066]|nr:hypothetical protein BKA62DRAFT_709784 [Auriculariales sp. MPI-PUGE-AT-0066]